jgi:hypothetical protein
MTEDYTLLPPSQLFSVSAAAAAVSSPPPFAVVDDEEVYQSFSRTVLSSYNYEHCTIIEEGARFAR